MNMDIYMFWGKGMRNITKDNIIPYLKEHMPELKDCDSIVISQVGEGQFYFQDSYG